MKIKLTAYIHFQQYSWDETGSFQIFYCKLDDTDVRTYVSEQEVEIEVPDNYDPRAQQIAVLEAQGIKAAADYQNKVTEIQRRISELKAISV